MADADVIVEAAPATSTKKAAAKKPAHPVYAVMVADALSTLNERKGSSRQAILKYILGTYKVGEEKKAMKRLKIALRKGVEKGALNQVKGTGARGTFKLFKEEAKPVKKAAPKKVTAKKPAAKKAAKKPAAKKAAKKPAAKKAAKKPAAKSAPKKLAAKSAPKKPAAKKSPKKPAAKKTVAKKPGAKKVGRPAKK